MFDRFVVHVPAIIAAAACGLVFSLASVYGSALGGTGFLSEDYGQLVVPFLGCFLISSIAVYSVACAVRSLTSRARGNVCAIANWLAPRCGRRSLVAHAFAMLMIWAVVIVALFPGSMIWDTYYQIDQCYIGSGTVWVIPSESTGSVVDAWFSDHHPIFDSLLYGLFALPSHALFGTWNYGVFAFVMLQSMATAFAFTFSVAYLEKLGVSAGVRSGVFLFYCIMPFFPFYAASMIKDSLFASIFVVYLIMICECARTRGRLFDERRNVAMFVVLGLLLALTKKPGMYIVVLTAFVLAVAYRGRWKAFAVQIGCVLLAMLVILPLVVFPLLHVVPGEKQEALGPLFQQTARYVLLYEDEVADDEREAIDRVLGYDDLAERYDPFNSDPVKFGYRYDACTTSDLVGYFGVWLNQGLRHPEAYIEAMAASANGYFNLQGPLEVIGETGDVEHGGTALVYHPGELQPLHDAVLEVYQQVSGLPAVGLLFRVGLYTWLVPSVALVSLLSTRPRLAFALVPVGISLLVCLVTPCFHARYALAIIYVVPFVAGMMCASADDDAECEDDAGRPSRNSV